MVTGLRAGPNFLEPEHERFAAGSVSDDFLILCAKKLIAQPKPAAKLSRRLCDWTRPVLPRKVCVEFSKGRILPEGEECDPRAFGEG